jgi:hypothetical protein
MARIWLVCALAVAGVVGLVLWLTAEDAVKPKPRRQPPYSPLSEQEVRAYLEVSPRMIQLLGKAAEAHVRRMAENRKEVPDPEGDLQMQAEIDALLERNHLTRETWRRLSQRIEYAVNVVRGEAELEKSRAEIEEGIRLKKDLLTTLKEPEARKSVEAEIRAVEARLAGEGPLLAEQDRELIRGYWRDLDATVPHTGAPPKRE